MAWKRKTRERDDKRKNKSKATNETHRWKRCDNERSRNIEKKPNKVKNERNKMGPKKANCTTTTIIRLRLVVFFYGFVWEASQCANESCTLQMQFLIQHINCSIVALQYKNFQKKMLGEIEAWKHPLLCLCTDLGETSVK